MILLRLLKKIFTADALGLILVFISLGALTYGISSSLRSTDTRYLFEVCLIAALFGFGLSKRNFSGFYASALIVAVGMIGLWILGARLTAPLLRVIQSLSALIPQILPAFWKRIPIDTSTLIEDWQLVLQGSSALMTRWQTWFISLNAKVTVDDTLIRSMIWALFMWVIAAWTGWFAARRNALLSLLPQIFVLSVILSYSERKVDTLWVVVLILLLLMGIWSYRNHTIQWERRRVDYSDSIRYDNTQAVVILAIFVGVFALITPSVSWRQIREFLKERNNSNRTAKILGVQEQPAQITKISPIQPSLPREHLLTEGVEQSQELVMTIRTGELPGMPEAALRSEVPRYYWRSTIYDRYLGSGWITSSAPPLEYKADTPLIPGLLSGYRPLHLDVQIQRPEGKLFWSGLLFSADTPLRANWRVRPQSSLFADQTALLEADLFAASTSATAYHAEVYVPEVSIEQLRNASTEYPEEITDHYLALPAQLPERIRELAKDITQGMDNPYDKAKAIETYLRTNYPYDLQIPAPPSDQDVSDYFLFDLKKGYCDYYATAMVVLARSSGLPARFVSGYSSGYYDSLNAQYVVRGLNAHSWAEVYFPEIGWIEFEPTASEPAIQRPEKNSELVVSSKPVTTASRFWFQITNERLLYWLSPLMILFALLVLYYAVGEQVLLMNVAPLRAFEILYRRFYRAGRPLAGEYTRAETASEFASKLIRNITEHNKNSRRAKISQQIQTDVSTLTGFYQSSLFSNHITYRHDIRIAYHAWRQLRWLLFIARTKQFLGDKITWIRNRVNRPSYKSM